MVVSSVPPLLACETHEFEHEYCKAPHHSTLHCGRSQFVPAWRRFHHCPKCRHGCTDEGIAQGTGPTANCGAQLTSGGDVSALAVPATTPAEPAASTAAIRPLTRFFFMFHLLSLHGVVKRR